MKGEGKIDEAYAGIFPSEEQVNSACFSWLDSVSSGFDMVKVLVGFLNWKGKKTEVNAGLRFSITSFKLKPIQFAV